MLEIFLISLIQKIGLWDLLFVLVIISVFKTIHSTSTTAPFTGCSLLYLSLKQLQTITVPVETPYKQ